MKEDEFSIREIDSSYHGCKEIDCEKAFNYSCQRNLFGKIALLPEGISDGINREFWCSHER